ncbi:MAG TPA: ABC transporter ATP-binding protein [Lacipirellulaceae bacterium]|jgi:branched-chain amino acid transport system ATP-binding protein|nr:ABC transporter ATP-binding protein [Lacipirellulaceae bacterium]
MNGPGPLGKSPLLSVSQLSAGYSGMRVLRDLSLEVFPSEIVAVVGSNGAGKTTMLRALSRLIPCTGSIAFDNRDLAPMTPDQAFAAGLVQVPEGRQLFDRMTVEDNLRMGAHLRNDRVAISRDLDKMYSLFPILGERRRQLAGSMSGGEQQMCAMARALMAEPRLLMIDEMSLGLAPIVVQQLVGALDTIRGEGVAILLVEQDVYLALDSADRGYVIEMGAVVHSGQAKALIDDSAVRQAYLGL